MKLGKRLAMGRLARGLLAGPLAVLALAVFPAAGTSTETEPYQFEETRQLVDLVRRAGERIRERGIDRACSEFEQPQSEWLHDEIYVFVFTPDGEAICHPARPELEGRNLLELRDPHGRPIVQSFIRELSGSEREGWVHYLWPKPGDSTFYWKSTYVREAIDEDTPYIVGSGRYSLPTERSFVVDQVEDAVRLLEREGQAGFELLRERSRGFRFLDAYLFVMAEDGTERVNLGFPELEGVNLLDLQDASGKLVSREMLNRLEDYESGWIEYQWPKPGEVQPSAKSSYIRRATLEGERFVVGAGVYLPVPPDP